MGQITAHLLEGFDHERVVLAVDDEPLASKDDVTTSMLIGSAGKLSAPLADRKARVEIQVPSRGLKQTRELDISGDAHLLASIEGGELCLQVADDAPGFM